jgi:DNA-binding transcriptional MerR regulator
MPLHAGRMRIGELSRVTGVSQDLLRAWERRYGLLSPARSPGGFRLYSDADEQQIRAMLRQLATGLSAAQAAQSVLAEPETIVGPPPDLVGIQRRLQTALEEYDEAVANEIFDELLAVFETRTVLTDVVLPVLRAFGQGWTEDRVTIAQEHFATSLLRGRLLGLARGWGRGLGPVAVLACPPGEHHDLPLVLFGLSLRDYGWRVAFLGADTPIDMIDHAAEAVAARAVIMSTVAAERLQSVERDLAALSKGRALAIGGTGAERTLLRRVGALELHGDPVDAVGTFLNELAA